MKFLTNPMLFVCATLALTSQSIYAKELITEYSGSTGATTQEFETTGPWLIEWLVDGEFGDDDAVDISLYNVETGNFEGDVLRVLNAGNGERLMENSGRFYFLVNDSMADWDLKIYQLTTEEAKQYASLSNAPAN